MKPRQFDETQRAQAVELIEGEVWGDMEHAIFGLEVALALALEATGDAIELWEAKSEERFRDEFALTSEEVAEFDDEWRACVRCLCRCISRDALPTAMSCPRSPGMIAWITWLG